MSVSLVGMTLTKYFLHRGRRKVSLFMTYSHPASNTCKIPCLHCKINKELEPLFITKL